VEAHLLCKSGISVLVRASRERRRNVMKTVTTGEEENEMENHVRETKLDILDRSTHFAFKYYNHDYTDWNRIQV
jgi:hypothetical protein